MVDRVQTEHTMVLDVQAQRMVRSLQEAEKELGDLAREFDRAQRTAKKWETVTIGAARSTKNAANQNRALSNSLRTAGYQVADIAVQMEMGTHWTRIFAQQGSQVLASFGLWGTILGAAAAAIIPLAKNMGWFGEEADEVATSLQVLKNEMDSLRFGVGTDEELKAMRDMNAAIERRNELIRRYNETDDLRIRQSLAEQAELQRDIERAAKATLDEYAEARKELERLKQEVRLKNQYWSDMLNPVDKINTQLDSMEGKLERMVKDAADMATEFWSAARANAQINAGEGGLQGQFDRESYGAGQQAFRERIQSGYTLPVDKAAGRAAGGGAEQVDEITRAIERMLPQVRRAIEDYESWGDTLKKDLGEGFMQVAESGIGSFVDMLAEGQVAWDKWAENILRDLAKMALELALLNILKMAFNGGGGAGGAVIPSAKGNVFEGGNIVPFASGGIVTGPTMFPMTNGTGLMGEAGPEAIVPLSRTSSGDLGVGAIQPNITIHNYSGLPVETRQISESETAIIIGRAVEAAEQNFVRQATTGQGAMSRAIDQGWSSKRRFA